MDLEVKLIVATDHEMTHLGNQPLRIQVQETEQMWGIGELQEMEQVEGTGKIQQQTVAEMM